MGRDIIKGMNGKYDPGTGVAKIYTYFGDTTMRDAKGNIKYKTVTHEFDNKRDALNWLDLILQEFIDGQTEGNREAVERVKQDVLALDWETGLFKKEA